MPAVNRIAAIRSTMMMMRVRMSTTGISTSSAMLGSRIRNLTIPNIPTSARCHGRQVIPHPTNPRRPPQTALGMHRLPHQNARGSKHGVGAMIEDVGGDGHGAIDGGGGEFEGAGSGGGAGGLDLGVRDGGVGS